MHNNIGNKFITILNEENIQRIDNFLIKNFKNVPKSIIYKNLRIGKIRINNHKILPQYKLHLNDVIYIPKLYTKHIIQKKTISINKINFLKKLIIFEDQYFLVINKPSGIAVHGGSGIHYGIIESLRYLYKTTKFIELVHRIDKDTSGILLIAKKKYILQNLHKQLREKQIHKEYLALVKGNKIQHCLFTIKSFLVKNFNNNKKKVQVHAQKGKFSETQYKVIQNYQNMMLVKIIPLTGRTHQIRVHMSYVGHPIAHDKRYGNKDLNIKLQNIFGLKRLFLHSYKISFTHPVTQQIIFFHAPLDPHLKKCLLKFK
ncbi:RluA family pseudouridine synthase [Enterobacteriaceae endosymbiont of Macroplea appendiculata]|uniref:RluA family pseudouridine synthase n=1 Tax=Enterobacteriaceae endosymbiont of Macroplea appendiculata TaxID=2675790 RepID=UPI001449CB4F|nr:RluA family pseudouridine synthase [Enterobacteriaceae endosymbiont of Macroplea appendiculata]QJC30702.1 RluA family pseudouridine synthase [Enterobacteriaceae endosymbiont of Macroplea appendiculata]